MFSEPCLLPSCLRWLGLSRFTPLAPLFHPVFTLLREDAVAGRGDCNLAAQSTSAQGLESHQEARAIADHAKETGPGEPGSEILIAAGGTGGHILPGIRIGTEIQESAPHFAVSFVSGKRPIEEKIYRAEGVEPWVLPLGQPQNAALHALSLSRSFLAALRRMISRRPAAVLAMGGAVCFPVLAAAIVLNIPVFLHESNRIPGRVTRLFSRRARKVFLGLGGIEGANIKLVGTPTKAHPHTSVERTQIVCVGGSQGAAKLNALFIGAAQDERLRQFACEFILISGPGKQASSDRVAVKEYEHDMPALLARTRLAVSRSGAGALADFANLRVPSILVPYPHAMDNHQLANAREYAEKGAALLMEEHDLTSKRLADELVRLLSSQDELQMMSDQLAHFDSSQSARLIVAEMLSSLQTARNEKPYSTPREASS